VHKAGACPAGLAIGALGLASDVTCRQFVELITDYLERALAEELMGQVDRHLLACEGCATYLEQMRATIRALGALGAT
jgi:anti-sigma factor RsiW